MSMIVNSSGPLTKLIFAGLDSAGKTTIYKATMKEVPVDELKDSRPTRGIDRDISDFMDLDFSVWDLGGQQSYRETYLSKPEIFNSTKALIFVLDIQDVDRFEEAYQYYLDIMNILINVEPRPKVYVLFHKFDPDKAAKLRSHFFRATKLFRQADKITGMKFTGFATSIYSDTIQKAVKRILWENIENFTPKMETAGSSEKPKSETVPRIGGSPAPKVGGQVPKVGSSVPSTSPKSSGAPTPTPSPAPSSSDIFSEKLSDKLDDLLEDVDEPTPSSAPTPQSTSAPSPAPSPASSSIPSPTPKPSPASPTPEPTPAVKETPPAAVPKVKEEPKKVESIPSPKYEEGKIYEEVPDLSDLSTHIVDQLSAVISKRMNETPEIVALAILGIDGKVPLAVAKSEIEKEKIEVVKNVVQSLSPKQFFKELGDVEYRGLGHLTFSDFDIYFAKLHDDYAIAILAVDVSTPMLENAQRIVKTIRQGLGMVSSDKTTEPEEEEEDKKVDLIGDLRSRLKKIGSLHNVDDN